FGVFGKRWKGRMRVVEFERCGEEVLEARVHFVHFGERLLCYGKNLRVVQVLAILDPS
ncbi:hypothetical protein Tco_0068775, partial [Tanacetum coccineum]